MGVNKIDSFTEKYGLGSGTGYRGKKVNQTFGKKNACEEAESFKLAEKYYHRCHTSERSLADYAEGDEAEQ